MHLIGRISRGGVDDHFAGGLPAIGAEIGDVGLQHAARQGRLDRGRRELRVRPIDLRRGNLHLGVDIVQRGEVDRRIAPALLGGGGLRPGAGNIEALEVEIDLHQRLAGNVDRTPAGEAALIERAGQAR